MNVTREAFDALVATDPDALFALFQQQSAQLAALTLRVQELEARLGGHSQNSHRPPSSDGPRTPPRSQRPRSGKAPGGQPGHPGHTLTMTATPDRVVTHRPEHCAHCGTPLAGVPAATLARRQVVDLPPLATEVTEHQAATVCCPHHLRELAAVAEQAGPGWAATLRALLVAMKRRVDGDRAGGRPGPPPAARDAFAARYRELLAEGDAANPPPTRLPGGPTRGRLKQRPARNLLDRLAARAAEVLAFLHDPAVPVDNNQAERDLRMIKVQQKISGTCRDDAGADAFCRIRSYLSTLHKQARQILTALEQTLAGHPPLPCLLPE